MDIRRTLDHPARRRPADRSPATSGSAACSTARSSSTRAPTSSSGRSRTGRGGSSPATTSTATSSRQPDPTPPPQLPDGAVRYDLVIAGRTLAGRGPRLPRPPRARRPGDDRLRRARPLVRGGRRGLRAPPEPLHPHRRACVVPPRRRVARRRRAGELAQAHRAVRDRRTRPVLPAHDRRQPEDCSSSNDRRDSCPYKGDAAFFDARIGDSLVSDIAWTYTLPRPEATPIAGLVCFYDEKVDIDIDGERQRTAAHALPLTSPTGGSQSA